MLESGRSRYGDPTARCPKSDIRRLRYLKHRQLIIDCLGDISWVTSSNTKIGRAPKRGAAVMNHDDHAALIEVKAQLAELRAQQVAAKSASAWSELQAEIEQAEMTRIEIICRTEPEDVPKL